MNEAIVVAVGGRHVLFWVVVFVFGMIVLVFDGLWASLAIRHGYNYVYGVPGSLCIYAVAGFAAAQLVGGNYGTWAGVIVAGVETVIGTPLANRIGAYGEMGGKVLRGLPLVLPIQLVVGAGCGAIGAMLASS
jgi:hypothetical protein